MHVDAVEIWHIGIILAHPDQLMDNPVQLIITSLIVSLALTKEGLHRPRPRLRPPFFSDQLYSMLVTVYYWVPAAPYAVP